MSGIRELFLDKDDFFQMTGFPRQIEWRLFINGHLQNKYCRVTLGILKKHNFNLSYKANPIEYRYHGQYIIFTQKYS